MNATSDAKLGMHMLEIEITTRCNLSCKHCYNRTMQQVDMPVDKALHFAEFAVDNDVRFLVFTGGEASLHPEFDKICSLLKAFNPIDKSKTKFVLQTNGNILNLNDISQLTCFDVIHISFEPDNSEVRVTNLEHTKKLVDKLKSLNTRCYLFSTVHSQNIDKIDWMVETANSMNVDIGFNLCSDNKGNNDLLLSKKQFLEISSKLNSLFKEGKILRYSCPLTALLNNKKSDEYMGIRGGCTAGIAACSILPDGNVIPCPFLRVPVGNAFQEDMESIWNHAPIFNELRNRLSFDKPCGECEYLSYCGGCRKRALEYSSKLTGMDPCCFKEQLLA